MIAPLPSLSGPFATAAPPQLRGRGYAQEEWFIDGRADAFDPNGVLLASAAPFSTRLLVRRPRGGTLSSGSVFFDPLHMIGEMPASWDSAAWLMDRGHTWVGVSVHNGTFGKKYGYVGGLDAVKQNDSDRYASLHLSAFAAPSPLRSVVGPGGTDTVALRWDMAMAHPQGHHIVTQVARLLRAHRAFSGLNLQRIYACGVSQTANFWRLYLDGGWHERTRTDDGRALFDGYVLMVSSAPTNVPADAVLVNILSEAEVVGTIVHPCFAPPDCERPRIRGIELPGSPHLIGSHHVGKTSAGHRHTSERYDLVVTAVLAALDLWVRNEVPMPHAPKIERDSRQVDGVARDQHGNALGGVRVPWVEVPRGHYLARCECGPTRGEFVPFDSEQMRSRYGDREVYEERWRRAVRRLVDDGFLLPEDVTELPVPSLESFLSGADGD
jgi:hypothetical protein